MKKFLLISVALLMTATAVTLHAQQPPQGKRTDLQRHDLSSPGREVVQVRVDFDPGYLARGTRISARRSSSFWKASWSITSRASHR